jgi:serine/threonine-protein kinase RsbT
MIVLREERVRVRSSEDVVLVRQMVRRWAVDAGFSLIDQTKVVTAASELARNTVVYGGGGTMTIQRLSGAGRTGLRLIFDDKGPGIADINLAMKDGFTTGEGLGLGLSGAKRLSNEFEISSRPGEGTRVAVTRWKT